jgi:hypothetical protein
MCKKLAYSKNGVPKKALMICDEISNIKILVYNSIDRQFEVEESYFVNDNFGWIRDFDALDAIGLSDVILYTNSESYLIQPRNNHGEPIMIVEVNLSIIE